MSRLRDFASNTAGVREGASPLHQQLKRGDLQRGQATEKLACRPHLVRKAPRSGVVQATDESPQAVADDEGNAHGGADSHVCHVFEVRVMVDDALLAASPLADAKRITLSAKLIDSSRLEADSERIFRVLSNLLGNAIKFTPEGGNITLSAERCGDELWITVADTGPGIAADELPHLFERYWKARPASQSGAGLGL